MTNQLLNKEPIEYRPESIITDWIEAIANFFRCYNQVITDIQARRLQQELSLGNKIGNGQCPVGELVTMASRMRKELEKLDKEMDLGGKIKKQPTRKSYKKLATHTLRLNQLTYQAQLRLDLGTVSAS